MNKYFFYDTTGERVYDDGKDIQAENILEPKFISSAILIIHWTDYDESPVVKLKQLIEDKNSIRDDNLKKKSITLFISGAKVPRAKEPEFKRVSEKIAQNFSANVFFYLLPHKINVEETIGGYLKYIESQQRQESPQIISPDQYYNYTRIIFELLLQTALISFGRNPDFDLKIKVNNMGSFWKPFCDEIGSGCDEIFWEDNELKQCANVVSDWCKNGCSSDFEEQIRQNDKFFSTYLTAWKQKIRSRSVTP